MTATGRHSGKQSLVGGRLIPAFEPSGHLPVGRYSCSPDEAKAVLVAGPGFSESTTRVSLWDSLERYLFRFFELEAEYEDLISGRLLDRFWLGGSFVSAKLNPANVDVTLILNKTVKDELKGRPGAKLFQESRASALAGYKVSPLFLNYQPVVSVFKLDELEAGERNYLAARGAWDDWWQRVRQGGEKQAPTEETCPPRRGYIEVVVT